jgi:hypothetical protein
MVRALLAHLQEVLPKQKLVFCMRVMSVSDTISTPVLVAVSRHNTHAKYQLLIVQCFLKASK